MTQELKEQTVDVTARAPLKGTEKLKGSWEYFQPTTEWQRIACANFVWDGGYRMKERDGKFDLILDVLSVNGIPCENPIERKVQAKTWTVSSRRLKDLLMPLIDKAHMAGNARFDIMVRKVVIDKNDQTKNTYEVQEALS